MLNQIYHFRLKVTKMNLTINAMCDFGLYPGPGKIALKGIIRKSVKV